MIPSPPKLLLQTFPSPRHRAAQTTKAFSELRCNILTPRSHVDGQQPIHYSARRQKTRQGIATQHSLSAAPPQQKPGRGGAWSSCSCSHPEDFFPAPHEEAFSGLCSGHLLLSSEYSRGSGTSYSRQVRVAGQTLQRLSVCTLQVQARSHTGGMDSLGGQWGIVCIIFLQLLGVSKHIDSPL